MSARVRLRTNSQTRPGTFSLVARTRARGAHRVQVLRTQVEGRQGVMLVQQEARAQAASYKETLDRIIRARHSGLAFRPALFLTVTSKDASAEPARR